MLIALILLCTIHYAQPYRILVYSPSISPSHLISNGRIADTLVEAGHDVTMFIPEYSAELKNFNGTKKAKIVRMSSISHAFDTDLLDSTSLSFANDRLSFGERLMFENTCKHMCEALMLRKHELEPLRNEKFDVAFTEQIDFCGVGVIRYLGIDNILWISTTPLMDAVSYNLGVPAPVSYVPTIEENDNSDVMSFKDRLFNLYMYLGAIYVHRSGTDGITEVFRRHVHPTFPNVREIAANSSLCFVNIDEMFDLPRPIIHKTIYVGGLGVREPRPLDEKFTKIMAKGEKGVIIVSLGSIAAFHLLPEHVRQDFVRAFKHFKEYHFVLKIAKEDLTTKDLFNDVKNFDAVEWLPQSDILAHPRLALFFMHGGINGLTEALLRGVPVIVMPVFADQFRNGRNVEKRGVGLVILKKELNYDNIVKGIQKMVSSPDYKKNAMRMKSLMLNKPFTAEERLIKWTEFAAEHGVLDVLHVQGSRMNFIEYFCLDVFVFLLFSLILCLYILVKVVRLLSSVRTKVKTQ